MDESLFLRARRLLGESRRPRPDHAGLCAEVKARQAASPTAQASAQALQGISSAPDEDKAPVAELVLGAPSWRKAARKQAGCFNRAVAARRVNTSATRLTGIFTVAL